MIPIYKLVEWVEEYRELWDNFVDWIMPPYFEIEPSRIHMLKIAQAYNVIIPKHSLSKLENVMQFYCIDPNVKTLRWKNLISSHGTFLTITHTVFQCYENTRNTSTGVRYLKIPQQ